MRYHWTYLLLIFVLGALVGVALFTFIVPPPAVEYRYLHTTVCEYVVELQCTEK